MKRRIFLKNMGAGSLVFSNPLFPFTAFTDEPNLTNLTILHTNDVHSRIDPFPMDGSRNQGLGGAAKRAAMIKKIRSEQKNILLLDSGDIFQGTPYFNFFGGELEFKLMSQMGYDAATIGNHDFDAGIDGLEKQLPHANFDFITSNYNFDNTILNGKTKPYRIFDKDGIKIGVIGIGIQLKGLVPQKLYKETQYLDPISTAQKQASMLKKELNCDYVICLSHLGYKYRKEKVSDIDLAQGSQDIDLILGGHTHSFMKKPDIQENKIGQEVVISQAGWAGIMLGRIDIVFEKNTGKKCVTCQNTFVK